MTKSISKINAISQTQRGLRGRRGGFTLLELITTMVLLGALMTMLVPLLAWTGAIRSATDHRELAVQESANLLEQLTARGWVELAQETADEFELSERAAGLLPGAVLAIDVAPVEIDLPAKRVSVELSWTNREGDRVAPVRLATVVFPPGGIE
jgi:prepilin-type N-terminal cleavage/methylation domain-containing protein